MTFNTPEEIEASRTCFTCVHWQGNKVVQQRAIDNGWTDYKNVNCFNHGTGWPESGGCSEIVFNGVDIQIYGDATADFTTDANFGCIHHQFVE